MTIVQIIIALSAERKIKKMAGTRTAPALTASATRRILTIRFIDASGDVSAESIDVPIASTSANLETIVAKYQLATQASVYDVQDTLFREGDADPDNAETNQRNSVKQGINGLFKAGTVTEQLRVVAPVGATMQGNSDIPLLSSTEMTELILAVLAVKTGFAFKRAQYTERRERRNNTVVK